MHSLLLAFVLCVSGQANAAAPDLTAGGVPNDSDQWNIGLAAGSGDDTPLNTSQFNNVTVTP